MLFANIGPDVLICKLCDVVDHSETQETWRLSEGFVVEEGRAVLPHLAKTR